MMEISKPRIMALLLMALFIVGASAKPSYTNNRKEQLHNRRGWFESNGATFTDLGDTNIEDHMFNRRGWFDSIGDTFNDLGDTVSDAASNVGDTVSDWGDDIGVHDWDDAIVDAAGNVGNTLNDWGGTVADAAVDLADTVAYSVQKRGAADNTVKHQKRHQKRIAVDNMLQHQKRDRLYNRRGDDTFSDLDDTLSDAAYYDSVSEAPGVQYLSVWDLLGDYVADADVDLADTVADYVGYQKRGAADDTVQHQKRRFTSLINNLGATLSDTAGNVGEALNDWGGRVGDAPGDFAETVVEPVLYDKRVAADNTVQHQKRHQESEVLDHMVQHQKRDQLYNRRGWFDSIGDTFSDLGDTLSDAASNVGDTVSDWGDDIGVHNWDDAIVDAAGNVGDTVSGWGDDIGIGHWDDAIADTAGNVGDTLSVWGGDAADAAGNVAGTLIDYMI